MENNPLRQQLAAMKQSFFDEGFLSATQFEQLEQLKDHNHPSFVEEVFTVFFKDTPRLLSVLDEALDNPKCGHRTVDRLLNHIKSSILSVGAIKLNDEVDKAIEHFEAGDMQLTKAALQPLKVDIDILKDKLVPYFQMLRQAGPFETADRPK
ncbi:putative Histidine-containing phosphotransfer protein [Quillaja saponaria]|uniref:Histidine-containing phosphotransfer protein n=1 Tax=Quillaja saponaria TaxID=32244 RepID=A0AAD7M4A5_QUISA|nr:putative Histidine-containing phosphotransfer protein [Quillaja saponaria]KAJ7969543.1 putative Histidine-containing phosphotransfer protein [Quillaja saponaria]